MARLSSVRRRWGQLRPPGENVGKEVSVSAGSVAARRRLGKWIANQQSSRGARLVHGWLGLPWWHDIGSMIRGGIRQIHSYAPAAIAAPDAFTR
ncbi:hypothetical protein N7462_007595 [Penicillium macrosclerotiorum]|uniref:uncharacterized protein n=1 Tax=Penicillium macrosclerotiorum TaxID=303699 RepID=UPI002547CB29|nr:uncharacterized protein N7462_007595 [Penicillium macrosclerotiorum]KAJ5679351.1 hypothetical protein N7462_007595 [Penicillium macrosclerotiorum]